MPIKTADVSDAVPPAGLKNHCFHGLFCRGHMMACGYETCIYNAFYWVLYGPETLHMCSVSDIFVMLACMSKYFARCCNISHVGITGI